MFPSDEKVPFGRGNDSGDDPHEGRFPGPVLPDDSMDFSRIEMEIDFVQGERPRI